MYFYHSMEFRIFVEENRKISLFDMNKKDRNIHEMGMQEY